MDPNIWGPSAWLFLHSIALNYPDNPNIIQKNNYINFINSFTRIIPCQKCKIHFKNLLKKHPINMKVLRSKLSFLEWINLIHNKVNIRLKKKTFTLDESIDLYKKIYKNQNK